MKIYKKFLNDLSISEQNLFFPEEKKFKTYVMFIALCRKRDKLQQYLNSKGIQTLVYYGTHFIYIPLQRNLVIKKGIFLKQRHYATKC